MIPLGYFVIAWLVIVAVFLILAFITVLMQLRFGLSGIFTYLAAALFLGVTFFTLLAVGGYLTTVDWTQTVQIVPNSGIDVLQGV